MTETRTTPDEAPTDERQARRASRRRLLRWAAIVVGIVVLLVVVPGYIATRPAFLGRYPGFADKQRTWAKSTHLEALCSDCHVSHKTTSQALYRGRMVGEFYLSFVLRSRTPDVLGRPGNAACLDCHNDLRSVSPKGDLQIPHRAHVQILKMECIECHEFLVHEKSPEGKNTPPMANCLKCHNGDTAEDDCNACHTEKAAPATHRAADWLVVHPVQASDAKCAKCHRWAKNWCADCHSHRPRSHSRNWRAVHGEHVKVRRSCEACHKTSFCVPCHGEVPKLNFNPELKLVE